MAIRRQYTEVLIGLFVFLGLTIMGILILQFGRFGNKWADHYPLRVDLPDATGIRKGVPVRMGGADLGFVADAPELKPDFSGMRITLQIRSQYQIPLGSQFSLATSGLLGDSYIKIRLPENPNTDFYEANAVLAGGGSANLGDLTDNADTLVGEVQIAIAEIRKAVQGLDRLFTKIEEGLIDEENMASLKRILSDLEIASSNIKQTTTKIDPIVESAGKAVDTANKAMTKIDSTFAEANSTFKEAKEAIDTIRTTVDDAKPTLGKIDPTLDELRELLRHANQTLTRIESGNGVAAALIGDSELRSNLEAFVEKLNRHGVLFYPREAGEKRTLFSPINLRSSPSDSLLPPSPTSESPNRQSRPLQIFKKEPRPTPSSPNLK